MVVVKAGRSGETVNLNPQQQQSFQDNLRVSFEKGNVFRGGGDPDVNRAVSFAFAEGGKKSSAVGFDQGQIFHRSKISRSGPGRGKRGSTPTEIELGQSLLPDLRRKSVAEVREVRGTTATERALRQSLPSQLRGKTVEEVKQSTQKTRDIRGTPRFQTPPKPSQSRVEQVDNFLSNRVTKPGINVLKRSVGLDKNATTEQFISKIVDPPKGLKAPPPKSKVLQDLKAFLEPRARGTLEGTVEGLEEQPLKAGVNLATFFFLPKGLGLLSKFAKTSKVLSKIPPSVINKLRKIPLDKLLLAGYLGSTGLEVAGEKDPRRQGKLIGRKLSTEVIPFQIGSKLGVRGVLRSQLKKDLKTEIAKLPKNKQEDFKRYIKQTELFQSAPVKDVTLKGLDRIPPEARPIILKYIRDEQVVLGGSVAIRTQTPLKRSFADSDLDLYLESGNVVSKARKLELLLKGSGIKRVSRVGSKVTIDGKKVAEFQDFQRLINNVESVSPFWKTPKSYIKKDPTGIKILTADVQAKRKLVGGFTDPKRQKDLKDFKDIANTLFKNAELNARQSFFFKNKKLKALQDRFGVKLLPGKKTPGVKLKESVKTIPRRESGLAKADRLKADSKPFSKVKKEPIKTIKGSQVKVGKPFRSGLISSQVRPPKTRKIILDRPSQGKVGKVRSPAPFRKKILPPPTRKIIDTPSQPPATGIPRIPRPFAPPTRTGRPSERKRPTTPPILFPKLNGKKRKIVIVKKIGGQAYSVFVKHKGKFIKSNKVPLTRNKALDLGSYLSDKSTSRQFLIKKTPGRPKQPKLRVPTSHFLSTQKKFRAFKIRKGVKRKLQNRFIEHRKNAIDTLQEKRRLSSLALRKRLQLKSLRFKEPKLKSSSRFKRRRKK